MAETPLCQRCKRNPVEFADEELCAWCIEAEACAQGACDHYVCTEGRSLDEWVEPEPTMWDYYSEGGFADPDPYPPEGI